MLAVARMQMAEGCPSAPYLAAVQDPEIQDWGMEEEDTGDPPRLWHPEGSYPGTAFTRSIGDSGATVITTEHCFHFGSIYARQCSSQAHRITECMLRQSFDWSSAVSVRKQPICTDLVLDAVRCIRFILGSMSISSASMLPSPDASLHESA